MKFMTLENYEKGLFNESSIEFKSYRKNCSYAMSDYEKTKAQLPAKFIEVYEASNHFHDTDIYSVVINKGQKSDVKNVEINFRQDIQSNRIKIIYENVQSFSSHMRFYDLYAVIDEVLNSILFSELISENGKLTHNMLLEGGSEINITFMEMKIIIN